MKNLRTKNPIRVTVLRFRTSKKLLMNEIITSHSDHVKKLMEDSWQSTMIFTLKLFNNLASTMALHSIPMAVYLLSVYQLVSCVYSYLIGWNEWKQLTKNSFIFANIVNDELTKLTRWSKSNSIWKRNLKPVSRFHKAFTLIVCAVFFCIFSIPQLLFFHSIRPRLNILANIRKQLGINGSNDSNIAFRVSE